MKNKKFSKIGTIIRHEYLTKIKSKWFIIGTLVGPLAVVLFFGVIIAVAVLSEGETSKKFAVLDKTGTFGKELVSADTSRYYLIDAKVNELKTKVLDQKMDGFILIPENFIDLGSATIFTSGGGGLGFKESLERSLGHILRRARLEEAGTSPEVIDKIIQWVKIDLQLKFELLRF